MNCLKRYRRNAFERTADALARVIWMVLGCAVAATLFENTVMIRSLAHLS